MPSFNRLRSDVRQLVDITAHEVDEVNGAESLAQSSSARTNDDDDDGDNDNDNDVDDADIGPPGFHDASGEDRSVRCCVVRCSLVRLATRFGGGCRGSSLVQSWAR